MKKLAVVIVMVFQIATWAEDPPALPDYNTDRDGFIKVVRENLTGASGHIVVPGGQVAMDLEKGYSYLEGMKGRFLLERLWENPKDESTLGVIIPPDFDPSDGKSWAAIVTYDNSGHISDEDAKKMDFQNMLKQMKSAIKDENASRKKNGYPAVELIGWATAPHYDSNTKKLYWAKELQFEGADSRTLNYMIRILGREGTLDIDVIAGMDELKAVGGMTPSLLGQINFVPGRTYADYNSGTDHLAEIGVAGLILGGIAVKAGLFKAILIAIAASWKFILLGLGALGTFVVRTLKKKKD